MIKHILLLPAVAFTVLTAAAAPLKRADVTADPSLVVHFDFDGLRATSIGKAILSQANDPDIDMKLSALQGIFGFDPRTQLHGATIYANSQTPPEGVLIVYAEFDSNRVVNLGKLAPGFHTITNGTRLIHTWLDEKKGKDKDGDSPHIFAAIQGNRIILGKAETAVAGALDVVSGSTPSLAGEKSLPELGAPEKGNVIQAVVRRFDFGGRDPNAAIFKMSKVVRLQAGETGDHLAATLSFEAKDTDTATQISAIAQGLVALLKLQQGNPDILKIANAISLHQDGPTVTATASILSKDVSDFVSAKVAEAEEKHSRDTNTNSASPQ